jgi:hypothetical protein
VIANISEVGLKKVESDIVADMGLNFYRLQHLLKSVKKTGQLEQDSEKRAERAGLPEHDSQKRIARTGQEGQDSLNRTAGIE